MPSSEDIQKLNTFRFYKSIITFNLGKYSPTAGNTEHSLRLLILLLYKIKPCFITKISWLSQKSQKFLG